MQYYESIMIQKRFANYFLGGSRSTKAVYGLILITAALIGFQIHETDALTLAIKVFFAGLAIVLAEAYSELLGEKIQHHKNLTKRERREIIHDAMVISSVAAFPVLVFLVSELGLYSTDTAFEICYTWCIAGLGLFGYIASRAGGDTKSASIKKALLVAGVGVVVVLTKYHFSH